MIVWARHSTNSFHKFCKTWRIYICVCFFREKRHFSAKLKNLNLLYLRNALSFFHMIIIVYFMFKVKFRFENLNTKTVLIKYCNLTMCSIFAMNSNEVELKIWYNMKITKPWMNYFLRWLFLRPLKFFPSMNPIPVLEGGGGALPLTQALVELEKL